MVREAPPVDAGGREAGYSQLARVPCEYGSCQCTRLTVVSSEAGLCLIFAVTSIGETATNAGEADFLKRS